VYIRPSVPTAASNKEVDSTFGVSGLLWRDSLVLYDRATQSLWSQVLGQAVAGPREGERLRELPSQLTTWGDWKRRHPDTVILRQQERLRGSSYDRYHRDPKRVGIHGSGNPDPRLPIKALVYGVEAADATAAASLITLQEAGLVQGVLPATGGSPIPVVVFSVAEEAGAAVAFRRDVAGRILSFQKEDGQTVRDRETGSRWLRESGECTAGALQGLRLSPIKGTLVYWGVWAQFHPKTGLLY